MVTISLSWMISAPDTLFLVFCTDQDSGDLKLMDMGLIALLSFGLTGDTVPAWVRGLLVPPHETYPDSFLNALGDFPSNGAGDSVEALNCL